MSDEKMFSELSPSRKLDCLIWVKYGWTEPGSYLTNPVDPTEIINGRTMQNALDLFPDDENGIARCWNVPHLTSSVDAAIILLNKVLPGWYAHTEPRFFIDDEKILWRTTLIFPHWNKYTPANDWFDNVSGELCVNPSLSIISAIYASEDAK